MPKSGKAATTTIQQSTRSYEKWLRAHIPLLPADLRLKHERMRESPFSFLRATFYRWMERWPAVHRDLASAPEVLAVGDLHVENFGTWRDAEGRLVWGINDFDEACRLPYVQDLVRLAASAHLALAANHLQIPKREADEAILAGYAEGLAGGGRPFVLAERGGALRVMATHRLRDPEAFWSRLTAWPTVAGELPPSAEKALRALLPEPGLPCRVVHRIAGLGSLGRQRYVAIAEWKGAQIAREAKALAPSAALWAGAGDESPRILYQALMDAAVRSPDPFVRVKRRWVVRRLAPDCSRIELAELPAERDEAHLLRAMGKETANVHLASRTARSLHTDLAARPRGWLHAAAGRMAEAVQEDWEAWTHGRSGKISSQR